MIASIASTTFVLPDAAGVNITEVAAVQFGPVAFEPQSTLAIAGPTENAGTDYFIADERCAASVIKELLHLYPIGADGEVDWRLAECRRRQAILNEQRRRARQARVARQARMEEAEAEVRADATQGRRLF